MAGSCEKEMRPVKDDVGVMVQLYSRKKIYMERDYCLGRCDGFS